MPRLKRRYRRTLTLIGFGVVGLIALTTGAIVAGLPHLIRGMDQAEEASHLFVENPQAAAVKFAESDSSFQASLVALRGIPSPLDIISTLPPFSWYVHLNRAAVYLSQAGKIAADVANTYPTAPSSNDPSTVLLSQTTALSTLLTSQQGNLAVINANLQAADDELQSVPALAALTRAPKLSELKRVVHTSATAFPQTLSFATEVRRVLGYGSATPITSLVIFQNQNELRPSGGFLGSYGVLNATNGIIRSFEFGKDIYKLEKSVPIEARTKASAPLQTITPWTSFRDSDVGAGFLPDIGEQVASAYAKTTGTTPPLIIFVNLSVLEDLLRFTGPVLLPGTTTQVTADTVGSVLTQAVEVDYWNTAENRAALEPKQVIGQLIPVIIKAVHDTAGATGALPGLIKNAVARKSLQLWTSDASLMTASARFFPLDTPPAGDWVKIVNTNLGGKKSSRNITQNVTIEENVTKTWRERKLTITRTHDGTGTWPDDENRNYTEVYLPPSAEVTQRPEARGGESLLPQHQQAQYELDSTPYPGEVLTKDTWQRVGFWATTTIGEKTTFVLKYRVPNDETFGGSFTYVQQAGNHAETLHAFGFKGEVNRNLVLEHRRWFW